MSTYLVRMQRYYFDVTLNADQESRDEEGELYPHVEAAEAEALQVAFDSSKDQMLSKGAFASIRVNVRDEVGPVTAVVTKFERSRVN